MTSKLLWKPLNQSNDVLSNFSMWMTSAACCLDMWLGGDQKCSSIFYQIEYSKKQDVFIPYLASKISIGF